MARRTATPRLARAALRLRAAGGVAVVREGVVTPYAEGASGDAGGVFGILGFVGEDDDRLEFCRSARAAAPRGDVTGASP
ncbi:hypothetical protein [Streptomyces sp. NPDC093260]|uniref:hypothetical protein n=1 Tax=Streptomyces sp. NPDC093260 TaxID=3155073 RepID=UPI00342FE328